MGNPHGASQGSGTRLAELEADVKLLSAKLEYTESMISEKDKRIQRYEQSLSRTEKDLNNRACSLVLSLLCGVIGLILLNYL